MAYSPMEQADSLRIGAVEFVSPDEIRICLDIDAPESVALNAGVPRAFPRVNSYVLIPVDDGYLVCQVEWLTVERSAFPKRRGMQDFGLVDLPYPLRKMRANPLGSLRKEDSAKESYSFKRGTDALPSIGVEVLLPTELQLRSIVESGARRRVQVGTSPLAANAEVCVDPDRLFGRHFAVLGNTGSGKSCSVAGVIRWTLEQSKAKCGRRPNARFIVLDPNGEYSRAFGGDNSLGAARIYKVNPNPDLGEFPLRIPLWFWTSSEWCSFTQASAKTQRPTLIQALRSVREGNIEFPQGTGHELRRFVRTLLTMVRININTGAPWHSNYGKLLGVRDQLESWLKSLRTEAPNLDPGEAKDNVVALADYIEQLCQPKRGQHPTLVSTLQEFEELLNLASTAHVSLGGEAVPGLSTDVDAPIPFTGDALLLSVEATAEMLNVTEYAETLLIRIRNLLSDSRMRAVIPDSNDLDLVDWLEKYVGRDTEDDTEGCVTVIDLSLVPTEIVHVLTAVVARIVFEALQRYRKMNLTTLPTVLVMEEAHTFVKRYREDTEETDSAGLCCKVFERIAREGRKFGLGLVLSSQRPSELSPTVLSQCNTYLLHRISNDRDQELVQKLVPDNLRGLLRELPSLPSQHAILLGWATELPILVRMSDLPKGHQPRSDDPDFWDVWTGLDETGQVVNRSANWQPVVDDWQGREMPATEAEEPASTEPGADDPATDGQ